MRQEAARNAVIAEHRAWLWARIKAGDERILAALREIVALAKVEDGVELACYCTRRRCHVETIAAAARWLDRSHGPQVSITATE